jgi:hypothetical protein
VDVVGYVYVGVVLVAVLVVGLGGGRLVPWPFAPEVLLTCQIPPKVRIPSPVAVALRLSPE